MILDYLAAGLDPAKQRHLRAEPGEAAFRAAIYLGMITPLGWLERVPSYKEMQENLATRT